MNNVYLYYQINIFEENNILIIVLLILIYNLEQK